MVVYVYSCLLAGIHEYSSLFMFLKFLESRVGWGGGEGRGERLGDVQRIRMEWRVMELRGLSAVQCSGLEWSRMLL